MTFRTCSNRADSTIDFSKVCRLLGILILYTAIIDPYRIAFIHALEDDLCRSFSVFDGFDIFIDIVFILNIAVQVGPPSFFFFAWSKYQL